ncbi:hypothetical protein BKI49_10715 [Streptomyces sp. Tue6028]|nr:hypothetical protein BKI49_10715 [Streptomyces sp. Tue6028]
MSVTPSNRLSIADPRDWVVVLVVIVVIYVPHAQLQGVLTNLIAMSAAMASGSAVSVASARRSQAAG